MLESWSASLHLACWRHGTEHGKLYCDLISNVESVQYLFLDWSKYQNIEYIYSAMKKA